MALPEALLCPESLSGGGCKVLVMVSEEDPDASLSEMAAHLRSGHGLDHQQAMHRLADCGEVPRTGWS